MVCRSTGSSRRLKYSGCFFFDGSEVKKRERFCPLSSATVVTCAKISRSSWASCTTLVTFGSSRAEARRRVFMERAVVSAVRPVMIMSSGLLRPPPPFPL